MKFRKRPVVVEARKHPEHDGFWIVTESPGCVWTMTDQDFAATYEPVEEGG